MHVWLAAFLFFFQPFWEAKAPEQWSDRQIETLRFDSPWAQTVGSSPALLMWLATAAPIEEAETEARIRGRVRLREPDPDYSYYLLLNRDRQLVLAVSLAPRGREQPEEERRMLDESVMIVGSRRYPPVGYFPPTDSDPVLRLVFPREVRSVDKTVVFRLYVPGVEFPDRELEFRVGDLKYHGKLAM